jgi:hypothetical protein
MDRLLRAAALMTTVALAGCGASSPSAPSATSTATSAAPTVAGSSTTPSTTSTSRSRAAAPKHRARPRHGGGANRTTSTRTTAASGTAKTRSTPGAATHTTRTRPASTPPGTPPAPAGLSPTSGYGSYELCQGTCSGSVPASLRRLLRLPADDGGPCPVTLSANGPISPLQLGSGLGFSSFIGSSWLAARVTWTADGTYTGPILIRGGQLGGGGGVGFGEGRTPYDELQLLAGGQQAPQVANGGRAWLSFTRVRAPGCYAYQVDGASFSEEIVFRAVG